MSTKTTLLGVDVGTTGCKATLYDLDGQPLRTGYAEYRMHSPFPGWVEEDPEDWWRAVVESILPITADPELSAGIAGLGVGCSNALVAVDKEGTPLRPAIMQLDQRTVPQADWLREQAGVARMLEISGNRVAPGSYSAPIILWLKEHEPETFAAAYQFLVPSGFIVHRLSGAFSMDYSRGSTTSLFDIHRREWSEELLQLAGVPREKLPPLVASSQVVGKVHAEAARQTGLREGTPVVAGCMDTVGAAVGSGVVDAGDSFAILGTVGRVAVSLDDPVFDDRFINCCHAVAGQWLSLSVSNGAGVSLRLFRDLFGQQEVAVAKSMAVDPYELLTAEAEQAPAGSNGLIYLPYIAAERSPIWDPYARGVFFGVSVGTQRGDFVRAIMEGVALSLRHNLSILTGPVGARIDKLRAGGGCARSPLWTQIIADVTGHTIVTMRSAESETLGTAILAGVGTGVYSSYEEARQRTLALDTEFAPRPALRPLYDDIFDLYTGLYDDLRLRFAEANQIQQRYATGRKE